MNVLSNDRNHNTIAVANDNNNKNDNSIATTIAIDILVMLVKSCSIKALLIISNTLLVELSYRGIRNAYYRIMSHRAFEEISMVTTMDTNDNADADSNNKENKLCFQLVIDSLSSSL